MVNIVYDNLRIIMGKNVTKRCCFLPFNLGILLSQYIWYMLYCFSNNLETAYNCILQFRIRSKLVCRNRFYIFDNKLT